MKDGFSSVPGLIRSGIQALVFSLDYAYCHKALGFVLTFLAIFCSIIFLLFLVNLQIWFHSLLYCHSSLTDAKFIHILLYNLFFFLIFLIVFLSRGVLSFLFFFHWHNYTVFLKITSPQPFGICFWRSPTVHFHLRDTSRILPIWYFLCSHLTYWGRVTHIYMRQ